MSAKGTPGWGGTLSGGEIRMYMPSNKQDEEPSAMLIRLVPAQEAKSESRTNGPGTQAVGLVES